MMKRMMVGVATALLAQGVWASEEAPYIGGQSAFSCDQVNSSIVVGNDEMARNMIRSALQQLDAAYGDETDIGHYYHAYVRNVSDYMVRYEQKLVATCTVHPDDDLTDAATDSLNALYQEHKTMARLAMCSSYNSSDVTHEMVLDEIRKSSVMLYTPDNVKERVALVYNSPKYGEQYIVDGVSKYCDQNPRARLWTTYGGAVNDAYNDLRAIAVAERKAAEDAFYAESRALNLANYGVSLTHKEDATCSDLQMQLFHAENDNAPDRPFVNGLISTLNAIADPLRDYERSAFEQAMAKSPTVFAREIYDHCPAGGGIAVFHAALMRTATIAEASTDGFKDIEPTEVLAMLSASLSGGNDCEPNYTCEEQSQAAWNAKMAMTACTEGEAEVGQMCFADPMDAFHYQLAFEAVKRLSDDHKKLKSAANTPISLSNPGPELSECKNKAIESGLRSEAYQKHVQSVCIPSAESKARAPILKQLADVDGKLEAAQESLEQLTKKGTAPKSS